LDNLGRNIDKSPAMGHIEPKFLSIRFHPEIPLYFISAYL